MLVRSSLWLADFSVLFDLRSSIVLQTLYIMREANICFNEFPACLNAFVRVFLCFLCMGEFFTYPFGSGIRNKLYQMIG